MFIFDRYRSHMVPLAGSPLADHGSYLKEIFIDIRTGNISHF
jgi:hypothetical protein